jgi:hypothetical protein
MSGNLSRNVVLMNRKGENKRNAQIKWNYFN